MVPPAVVPIRSALPDGDAIPPVRAPADLRPAPRYLQLLQSVGLAVMALVIVPLALTHRILGQLVGARRPTVSTALAELAERGELVRRPDGSWLLQGDPPDAETLARRPATGQQTDLMRPSRRFERTGPVRRVPSD